MLCNYHLCKAVNASVQWLQTCKHLSVQHKTSLYDYCLTDCWSYDIASWSWRVNFAILKSSRSWSLLEVFKKNKSIGLLCMCVWICIGFLMVLCTHSIKTHTTAATTTTKEEDNMLLDCLCVISWVCGTCFFSHISTEASSFPSEDAFMWLWWSWALPARPTGFGASTGYFGSNKVWILWFSDKVSDWGHAVFSSVVVVVALDLSTQPPKHKSFLLWHSRTIFCIKESCQSLQGHNAEQSKWMNVLLIIVGNIRRPTCWGAVAAAGDAGTVVSELAISFRLVYIVFH